MFGEKESRRRSDLSDHLSMHILDKILDTNNICVIYGHIKLASEVEISYGAARRLDCLPGQHAQQIRIIEHSRPSRLYPPLRWHCTRDRAREHPQGIQHADEREWGVWSRMLVELNGVQGDYPEWCRRCEQADESVPRRASRISAKCPSKWQQQKSYLFVYSLSFAVCFVQKSCQSMKTISIVVTMNLISTSTTMSKKKNNTRAEGYACITCCGHAEQSVQSACA